MPDLSDLVKAGEANIVQIVEALDEVDFAAMASIMADEKSGVRNKQTVTREIAEITTGLYAFQSVIEDATQDPDSILMGYELFLLNYDTKGRNMSGKYVETMVKRVRRHRETLRRYSKSDNNTHDHYRTTVQKNNLSRVRREFEALGDIYDLGNFNQVVDAMNTAYHAPRLTENARNNFGLGWFGAGETVFRLKRGLLVADELKENHSPEIRRVQDAAVVLHYHVTTMDSSLL